MAVQQLPTGLEPIIEGFTNLAGSATKAIFDDEIRQRKIQNDPEMMIQLASMARAAQREGAMPELAESLKLEEDFLTQLADAFVPSSEERFQTAFLEAGGPELLAETTILQQVLQGQTAEAAIGAALPFREADARLKGIEAEIAENEFTSELFQLRVQEGIPEFTVNLEALQSRLAMTETSIKQETWEQYSEFINDEDLDPHMRMMATLSLANPNMAAHVQWHENADLQMSLKKLAGSQGANPADQFATWLKLRDARTDAIDRARVAREEGEEDDMRAAVQDLATLNSMQERLTNAGLLPWEPGLSAQFKEGFLFLGDTIELYETIPSSDRVNKIFDIWKQESEAGNPISEQDIAEAREPLIPEERAQFDARLNMLRARNQVQGGVKAVRDSERQNAEAAAREAGIEPSALENVLRTAFSAATLGGIRAEDVRLARPSDLSRAGGAASRAMGAAGLRPFRLSDINDFIERLSPAGQASVSREGFRGGLQAQEPERDTTRTREEDPRLQEIRDTRDSLEEALRQGSGSHFSPEARRKAEEALARANEILEREGG